MIVTFFLLLFVKVEEQALKDDFSIHIWMLDISIIMRNERICISPRRGWLNYQEGSLS